MSWSLRVSNGDFVLDGTHFGTVTHENKLTQDLRHFLLTRMGTDPQSPTYGSLIDGGVKPNGQEVESVIARTDWGQVKLELSAEIRRIAAQYQRTQVERAKRDRLRYNKSTLTPGEILLAINDIRFVQNADALLVTIVLQSGRGQDINLDLELPPVYTR